MNQGITILDIISLHLKTTSSIQSLGLLSHMIPAHTCISPVISQLLRKQPMSPAKLSFAWRTAVGETIHRASTVTLTKEGILEVWAVDQHWRREIQRATPVIIPRLQRLLHGTLIKGLVVDAPVEKRAPRRVRTAKP